MTKKENMEDPNSCWNKAKDNEPVFILRAHDELAPETIRHWVTAVYANCGPELHEKVANALNVADSMEEWPDRKLPD